MNTVPKFIFIALWLSISRAGAQGCEQSFTREVNMSNGKIYFDTSQNENISFVKIISEGYTTYYLTVKNTGRSVKSPLKGVSVLLGDRSKIERPDINVTIDLNTNRTFEKGKFLFCSYFTLSLDEVSRIKTAGITDFSLYTSNYSLSSHERKSIKEQAGCLVLLR